MNKSNVTQWNTAGRVDPPFVTQFECPLCKKTVSEDDFITSYRVIEGTVPPVYRIKNLCRSCRDSGE